MDLHNILEVRRALSPVSVADNTAQVSQIIDTANRAGLEFHIAAGAIADADVTFTVLVEHGDQANLSDAAAVDDADLIGTEVLAAFQFDDDNEVRKIGYRGSKRYVRLTITPANNASGALLAVTAVLGGARKQPVA